MNEYEKDRLQDTASRGIRALLRLAGEDPDREGLRETPDRFIKAFLEMTEGTRKNFDAKVLLKTFDSEGYDELILSKDIPMDSVCEHHLLPFRGVAHVAYIPNGKIVGLSKMARLVDAFAKRPQVQERLTMQVASSLNEVLAPKGAACVMEATHSCQSCRGVRKSGSTMVTSCLLGVFRDPAARAELFNLIRSRPQIR